MTGVLLQSEQSLIVFARVSDRIFHDWLHNASVLEIKGMEDGSQSNDQEFMTLMKISSEFPDSWSCEGWAQKCNSTVSWADIVEQEELEKENIDKVCNNTEKKETSEAERKIFVGGLTFDDIEGLENSEKLKATRVQLLHQIFYKFGKVVRFQEHWDKQYCFVLYKTKGAAEKAVERLKDFHMRENIYIKMKKEEKAKGTNCKAIPPPNYYVRLPKVD